MADNVEMEKGAGSLVPDSADATDEPTTMTTTTTTTSEQVSQQSSSGIFNNLSSQGDDDDDDEDEVDDEGSDSGPTTAVAHQASGRRKRSRRGSRHGASAAKKTKLSGEPARTVLSVEKGRAPTHGSDNDDDDYDDGPEVTTGTGSVWKGLGEIREAHTEVTDDKVAELEAKIEALEVKLKLEEEAKEAAHQKAEAAMKQAEDSPEREDFYLQKVAFYERDIKNHDLCITRLVAQIATLEKLSLEARAAAAAAAATVLEQGAKGGSTLHGRHLAMTKYFPNGRDPMSAKFVEVTLPVAHPENVNGGEEGSNIVSSGGGEAPVGTKEGESEGMSHGGGACLDSDGNSQRLLYPFEDVSERPEGTRHPCVLQFDPVTTEGQVLYQIVSTGKIFIRSHYWVLASLITTKLEGRGNVIISGTPGVGKSLFGLFFVYLLRNYYAKYFKNIWGGDECPVIYYQVTIVEGGPTYLCKIDKDGVWRLQEFPVEGDLGNSILVMDGPCSLRRDPFPRVLWITSPRAGQDAAWPMFFMPPWTVEELIECYHSGCVPDDAFVFSAYDEEMVTIASSCRTSVGLSSVVCGHLLQDVGLEHVSKLCTRFLSLLAYHLGPVPRRVFNAAYWFRRLAGLVADATLPSMEVFFRLVNVGSDSQSVDFPTSHIFFLIDTLDREEFNRHYDLLRSPYTVKIVRLASNFIFDKMTLKNMTKQLESTQNLLGHVQGASLGVMYEMYAHFLLSNGLLSGVAMTRLYRPGKDQKPEVMLCQLCKCTTIQVSKDDVEGGLAVSEGCYYKPIDSNFPAIDSFTSKLMFQVTVSNTHPVKAGSRAFQALLAHNIYDLVFVVPEDSTLGWQPYVNAQGAVVTEDKWTKSWGKIRQWKMVVSKNGKYVAGNVAQE